MSIRILGIGSIGLLLFAAAAGRADDECRPPAGDLRQEVLWDSRCEEPAGAGLAFGGQSQSAPDGQPHTRVKRDGQWVCIVDELRTANPLRKPRDELWKIRTRLKDAISKARFIYFEGLEPAGRKQQVGDKVDPELALIRKGLEELAIRMISDGPPDLVKRVDFAREHVTTALASLKPVAAIGLNADVLGALRQAQQQLEVAAEALDAEPPPRVCSPIVYDPASRRYVLFGGDHFDYLTNDTWIFDPAQSRWEQRYPRTAPPPRAGHTLTVENGIVKMSGGFNYTSSTKYAGDLHKKGVSTQYANINDGQWTYDIAKNVWTGPPDQKGEPPDSRRYRTGPYAPEHFMTGAPDARANEAKLAALPVNTWTKMGVPRLLFLNRDWGTAVLDTDRDLILFWSGGHCVHSGSDVPQYHLATNRWELPFPIEMPLGFIGMSGMGIGGRNFNGRPWMSNHTWKAYVYDRQLRKMVVVGRNDQKHDRYTYLYDPDVADWTDRIAIPETMNSKPANIKVCTTPRGILAWTIDATELYMLDRKTLKWSGLAFEGKLPTPNVDAAGLVYDPKRDRVLFVQKAYAGPFSGQMYALDLKTSKVAALSPGGMDRMSWLTGGGLLREIVHWPESDLFLFGCRLPDGAHQLAYDPVGNEWRGVAVGGEAPFGYSFGMNVDPKRKLIWGVQGQVTAGEVFVLKFDPGKSRATPVVNLVTASRPDGKAP